MVDIFERLEKNTGGPIGQYMQLVHGYFAFPKLEGELGPHMKFRGKEMQNNRVPTAYTDQSGHRYSSLIFQKYLP